MRPFFAILFLVLTLLPACGKNDGVVPYGQAYMPPPPSQYPNYSPGTSYPPSGGYPYSPYAGGQSPQGGYYPQPGGFQPAMPSGMPPQYTPFLPIDNYFRRTPGGSQYWSGFWQGWVQFAGQRGYNPYDFGTFWGNYAPQQWYGQPAFGNLYNYYNTYFYYWSSPQTQYYNFSYTDPNQFWGGYSGMPYCDCGC